MNTKDLQTDYESICRYLRLLDRKARAHRKRICYAMHQTFLRPDGFLEFRGEPYLRNPTHLEHETQADVAARRDQEIPKSHYEE